MKSKKLRLFTHEAVIVPNLNAWKNIVNAFSQEQNARIFVNAKDVKTIIIDIQDENLSISHRLIKEK